MWKLYKTGESLAKMMGGKNKGENMLRLKRLPILSLLINQQNAIESYLKRRIKKKGTKRENIRDRGGRRANGRQETRVGLILVETASNKNTFPF